MKYLRISFFLCITATILFLNLTSCRKDKTALPGEPMSLDQFFQDNLEDYRQQYTFNAQAGTVIYAHYGTMIIVDSGSFVDQNGNPVTGLVDLELIELITKDAMLSTRMPTVSDNRVLFSGGQLFLEASQDGQSLKLDTGKSLLVRVPMTTYTTYEDTALSLFYGVPDGDVVNWISGDSIGENSLIVFNIGPAQASLDFNLDIPDLGWINCDYFPEGPRTDLLVSTPPELDPANIIVMVHFTDINSLGLPALNTVDGFVGLDYPIGEQVTIITLCEQGGKIYSSFDEIEITNGLQLVVDPQETTIEQLESDFWALDN